MKSWNLSTLWVLALLAAQAQAADKRVDPGPTPNLKIPTYVSYDVVARADDLRESVVDLISSLNDAGPTFGFRDWKKEQSSLSSLKSKLADVAQRLELKKERTDNDTWSAFVVSPTFSTTINNSLKNMGDVLNQIAGGMKEGGKRAAKMPIRVAANVVDQVDSVRRDVVDLIDSIEAGGRGFTYFDWSRNEKSLADFRQRLNGLKEKLEHKTDLADNEWTAWFGGDIYKVTVHDSVAELGSIVDELATAMAGSSSKVDD